MVLTRHPLAALSSLRAGLALVIFAVVEFAVVDYVSWIQLCCFSMGLLIMALAVLPGSPSGTPSL